MNPVKSKVSRILGKRKREETDWYLVEWEEHDVNTWEPKSNLTRCVHIREMLKEFNDEVKQLEISKKEGKRKEMVRK